jgi:hypothetical protein
VTAGSCNDLVCLSLGTDWPQYQARGSTWILRQL